MSSHKCGLSRVKTNQDLALRSANPGKTIYFLIKRCFYKYTFECQCEKGGCVSGLACSKVCGGVKWTFIIWEQDLSSSDSFVVLLLKIFFVLSS